MINMREKERKKKVREKENKRYIKKIILILKTQIKSGGGVHLNLIIWQCKL